MAQVGEAVILASGLQDNLDRPQRSPQEKNHTMRILVSNDDGYQAPGLLRLAAALSELADITVVAPDRDRSGASNSLSLKNPLYVTRHDNGFYSVAVSYTHLTLPTSDLV